MTVHVAAQVIVDEPSAVLLASLSLTAAAGAASIDGRGGGGMADAADLKSAGRKAMWVRPPPALPATVAAQPCTGRAKGYGQGAAQRLRLSLREVPSVLAAFGTIMWLTRCGST